MKLRALLALQALFARQIDRRNRSETGLVSTREYTRLQTLMAARFSTSAVNARSLTSQMGRLRTELAAMAAVRFGMPPGLVALGGAAAAGGAAGRFGRAAAGSVLGTVAAGATGISFARTGERALLEDQRLTALGAPAGTRELLINVAIRGGEDLQGLIDLYARLQIAGRDFGATQGDLIQLTQGQPAAARLQGQSFGEISGALRRLTQSLAGTRQLEELNSIIEGTPIVAQALARGLRELVTEPDNPDARVTFNPMTRSEVDKWLTEGQVELFDELVFQAPPEAQAESEPEATIYIRLPRGSRTVSMPRLRQRIPRSMPGSCGASSAA